jgi:hypothetical protein
LTIGNYKYGKEDGIVEITPNPKGLSKSPTVAGVFVCGIMGRFGS